MTPWQLSEHSFRTNFSEFSESNSFYSYSWSEAKDWPKFNFIRPKSESYDTKEFNQLIKAKMTKGESVNLKLGLDSQLPENLNYSARLEGTPISFVSTKASDFLIYKPSSVSIEEVKSIEQLKTWWAINSAAQQMGDPFSGPLWKKIEKIDLIKNRYYLLKDHTQEIGCFALTEFGENLFNLFGVAIAQGSQSNGHLNDIYHFIGKNFTQAEIYVQINIDAKTLVKRRKLQSTVIHAKEKRLSITPRY